MRALHLRKTVQVTIDINDLIHDFTHNSNESDLLELIKDIDLKVGDWTFTLKLCEYFAEKKKEWEAEEAEDKARAEARAKL